VQRSLSSSTPQRRNCAVLVTTRRTREGWSWRRKFLGRPGSMRSRPLWRWFRRHPNLLVLCTAECGADQPGEAPVVTDSGWSSRGVGHRRGQRAESDGAVRCRADGRLPALGAARRAGPAPALTAGVRPAGAVRRDRGGAGVGWSVAARSGHGGRVDDEALGAVRAAGGGPRAASASRCGASRGCAPSRRSRVQGELRKIDAA
jgi:hypothetical protein